MTAPPPAGPKRPRRPDRTAVASHEIRGPLGVVEAYAGLLLAGALDPEQRRMVALIRLAGAHALTVAEDLVADASLSAGRFRVVDAALDPADLVHGVAALWAPLVADGTSRLVVRIAPDCPSAIRSDAGRLRQILFNLVSNAAKAADSGPITLSVERADRPGRLRFTVADEGPGLPAGFQPAPFVSTGDRPRPGAGLGLWISERIATALGGTLTLADRPEGGALAVLDIPVRRRTRRTRPQAADVAPAPSGSAPADPGATGPDASATAGEADAPPAPTPEEPAVQPTDQDGAPAPRTGSGSPLAGRRALVVDDSAVSRMLLETILTSFDMTVDLAATGTEAVARAAAAPPDLILLDWALARETGAEVLDRLALALGPNRPPVVSVSASTRSALGAGAVGHVVKPFTPRELHAALVTALDGATDAASAG